MTKLKLTGKSNILKKTSSSINKKDFLLAVKEAAECPEDSCGVGGEPKKYVALLMPGNDPSVDNPITTVFENTLGSDITWIREYTGTYSGQNINFSNPNKVHLLCTGSYSNEGNGNVRNVSGEVYGTNQLWFATQGSANLPMDYWGAPIFIEIKVYP